MYGIQIKLDNLPRSSDGRIDWNNSKNIHISFLKNEEINEFIIEEYNSKTRKLNINYHNKNFYINTSNLLSGHIGKIVENGINYDYIYKVGDIINHKKILECIRKSNGINKFTRGYKVECLFCHDISNMTESSVKNSKQCLTCTGRKIKKGFNDLWTTNPEIALMLLSPEDGYLITKGSHQPKDWKCPTCGLIIKQKKVYDIVKRGNLPCKRCNDGVSFPEKIMTNLLINLNIDFKTEYNTTWCHYIDEFNIKHQVFYDFYFKINKVKYLVEMDGGFHYFDNSPSQTLEETQKIDQIKNNLAEMNNYNIIRIDCNKSDFELIKNNILLSNLNTLFDLTGIDWNKIYNQSLISNVITTAELYNKGLSMEQISKEIHMSVDSIRNYLKTCSQLQLCSYNQKENQRIAAVKSGEKRGNPVICLNDNQYFSSGRKADLFYGCPKNAAAYCARNYIKYTHDRDGNRLYFQYACN